MASNESLVSGPVIPKIVERELSYEIQGSFLDVYYELKYGLTEQLYARALEIALKDRGLRVEREYPIEVMFRGKQIGFQRLDMLVERRVIVEIKATERLGEAALQQLRCYVTASKLQLGILFHFGPKPRIYRELLGYRRANSHVRGISGISGVSSPSTS